MDGTTVNAVTLVSLAEYIEAVEDLYKGMKYGPPPIEKKGFNQISYTGPFFTTTLGVKHD
jgi:hypothetical protein